MSRTFKKIPQELESKVVIVTGAYPGVGKSFVKNDWCNKLRVEGYRVFNCGTTQKASEDATVASNSRLNVDDDFLCTKVHTQTNGFYFVDEAFLWNQSRTDNLIAHYPHMCFVLFGDPLQFDPVEGGQPLIKYDIGINLTKQWRAEDNELLNAIKTLKEGRIPLDFLYRHSVEQIEGNELRVCYKNATKDAYNKVTNEKHIGYIYRSLTYHNGASKYENTHHYRDLPWKNGQLWIINKVDELGHYDMSSLDGKQLITVNEETIDEFFSLHMAINNHKIQGDTISKVNLWVDLDGLKGDLLYRHLYVAISRATKSSQIKILKSQIDEILSSNGACLNSNWYASGINTEDFIESDSTTLTKSKSFKTGAKLIDYLVNTLKEFESKKPSKNPPTSRLYITKSEQENVKENTSTSTAVSGNATFKSNNNSNPAQSEQRLAELTYKIEKNRRSAIQQYLIKHYGIGYSRKWTDEEKEYADLIRHNYTKVELFLKGTLVNGKKIEVSELNEDEKREAFFRKADPTN